MKRIIAIALLLALLITLSGCELSFLSGIVEATTNLAKLPSDQQSIPQESACVQDQTEIVETTGDTDPDSDLEPDLEPDPAPESTQDIVQEEISSTEPITEVPATQISGVWSLCHDGVGDVLLLKLSNDGAGVIKTYYGEEYFQWSVDGSDIIICRNGTTESCPYSFGGDFLHISYQGMSLMFRPKE